MTTESENIEILKHAYQQWSEKRAEDITCWTSIMADDARLTSLAEGAEDVAFTKARSGKSEVLDYLRGLTNDWEMLFYRIDEFIAQGDRVVALGSTSWRNKRSDKVVLTAKADIWRMKNGKVVQFSEFYDTAKLIAAAQP
jgi:ketosteroid isomerase-like protein